MWIQRKRNEVLGGGNVGSSVDPSVDDLDPVPPSLSDNSDDNLENIENIGTDNDDDWLKITGDLCLDHLFDDKQDTTSGVVTRAGRVSRKPAYLTRDYCLEH